MYFSSSPIRGSPISQWYLLPINLKKNCLFPSGMLGRNKWNFFLGEFLYFLRFMHFLPATSRTMRAFDHYAEFVPPSLRFSFVHVKFICKLSSRSRYAEAKLLAAGDISDVSLTADGKRKFGRCLADGRQELLTWPARPPRATAWPFWPFECVTAL